MTSDTSKKPNAHSNSFLAKTKIFRRRSIEGGSFLTKFSEIPWESTVELNSFQNTIQREIVGTYQVPLSQHTCEACGQALPQRKTP